MALVFFYEGYNFFSTGSLEYDEMITIWYIAEIFFFLFLKKNLYVALFLTLSFYLLTSVLFSPFIIISFSPLLLFLIFLIEA